MWSIRPVPGARTLALWIVLTSIAAAEPPFLHTVVLKGIPADSEARAREVIELAPGGPFDPEVAQAASGRLMEWWRKRYYPLAKVRWTARPTPGQEGLDLIFVSEPGPRGRLKELRFTGNHRFEDNNLRSVLSVVPREGWHDRVLGNDILWIEDLADDQAALLAHYRQHGYMDAVLGTPDLKPLAEEEGFVLVWPILKEGPRYRVGRVTVIVDGDTVPSTAHPAVDLQPGTIFQPGIVREAGEVWERHLQEQGYAFAEVEAEIEWRENPPRADLIFQANRGGRPVLRKVVISGNLVTRDSILLREIPLEPGDPFHPGVLNAIAGNLNATGIFSTVEVGIEGAPENPTYDVYVNVEEKSTGRIETGLAYDTAMGPSVFLRVLENNFALSPPWRGKALRPFASVLVGTEILILEAGLIQPRIGDSPWGFDVRASYRDSKYISDFYNQKGYGASWTFTRPLGARQSLSAGLTTQHVRVYDISPLLQEELQEENNELDFLAPVLSWSFGEYPGLFQLRPGIRMTHTLQWGLPLAGNFTNAVVYEGRGQWVMNLWFRHRVRFRGGLTSVDPMGASSLPLPLRVWIGGPETLRGFQYQSVSPIQNGVAIGGQSAAWAGVEYIVPVHPRLDVSVYREWGTFSGEAWSFATENQVGDWGIGFQLVAENFPLRLDIAFPTKIADGDLLNEVGEPLVSFSAGYQF